MPRATFEFDPDTIEQFRNYRRERRRAGIAAARQVIGGAAEGMRTGASAVDTFGKRAPKHEGVMTREQKTAVQEPLLKMLQQQEQFESGQVQERYLKAQTEANLNHRAAIQALTQRYATATGAAKQAAANTVRVHGDLIASQEMQMQRLTGKDDYLSPAAQATAQGFEYAKEQATLDLVGQFNDLVEEAKGTSPEAMATRNGLMTAHGIDVAAGKGVAKQVRRAAEARAAQMGPTSEQVAAARALLDNDDPTEAVNDYVAIAAKLGVDPNTLAGGDAVGPLQHGNAYQEKAAEAMTVIDEATKRLENEQQLYLEDARKTWASDPGISEEFGRAQQGVRTAYQGARGGTGAAAPTQGAGASFEDLDAGGTVEVSGEGVSKNGVFLYEGREYDPNGFLGLPGVVAESDSQARILQLFDLIEQHPEHPPLQEARKQITGSEEFARYKKVRGYEGFDENQVFREMKREMRVKERENRQAFRDKKQENIMAGVTPGRGLSSYRRKKKASSTLASGRVMNTATSAEEYDGNPT